MQDRFKFKYFYNNTMCNVVFADFVVPYVNILCNGELIYLSKDETELENLVQCTGLKDKNGKLIYEGNILRHNGKLLIVKYQEEMACFAPQHFYLENDEIVYCSREWFEEYNNENCKLYTSNSYEVIGNIYENPELLESEEE